jgi:hypothetical protein
MTGKQPVATGSIRARQGCGCAESQHIGYSGQETFTLAWMSEYGFLFSDSPGQPEMATQRLILAKISGAAAEKVAEQFRRWEQLAADSRNLDHLSRAVDHFAETLCAHAHRPPVTYFAQWIDLWSMGDFVPGLGRDQSVVVGTGRFEACCHDLPVAVSATTIDGAVSQETLWLKNRINEAEQAWADLASASVLVILREPLGSMVTDEELLASQLSVPPWLSAVLEEKE